MNYLKLHLPPTGVDLRSLMQKIENYSIDEALRLTKGNQAHACGLLNMNRTTLVEKLRRRGLLKTRSYHKKKGYGIASD